MEKNECSACRRPGAGFECGLCHEQFCKKCSQMLPEDTFGFWSEIPESLRHRVYCGACYDSGVLPFQEEYEETIERAKEVFVFFKTQRKEIPLTRRSKLQYRIDACKDRDETIFRLAFFAAKDGYNAIIETDVSAKKVRNEGYQTSIWSGTAVPASVDAGKMDLQDRVNQIYR